MKILAKALVFNKSEVLPVELANGNADLIDFIETTGRFKLNPKIDEEA